MRGLGVAILTGYVLTGCVLTGCVLAGCVLAGCAPAASPSAASADAAPGDPVSADAASPADDSPDAATDPRAPGRDADPGADAGDPREAPDGGARADADAVAPGGADAGPAPTGCAGSVPGCVPRRGALECTLTHGGLTRTYRLHVPAAARNPPPAGAPVVFMFHGLRTTAAMMEPVTGLADAAAREGFVLALPEGVGMSFDAGRCCGDAARDGVDDDGFTLAILDVLARALCVDRRRVYATGLSNGGHMAYRLACAHPEVFAAVSSVAGVVATWPCQPTVPIPILHFHGTDDAIVRYDLGIDGHGAERTVADWAERNGCADRPVTTLQRGEVSCVAFPGCAGGAAAELCTIAGGGHQWPGGRGLPLLGHTTQDISATDASWAFFSRFTRP
jgi:polyhydroxybutyrate depolymerase